MIFFKRLSYASFKLLFLLNFIVSLLILYPFFYLLLNQASTFGYVLSLKRWWAKWILLVPPIFVRVEDNAQIKTVQGPCIFCANHSSYLDIVISYVVLPQFFVFMGKKELLKAPLFNIFFKKKLDIVVDRKSRSGSHQAFLEAGERLDRGQSVFMFPEGTISTHGQLKAFKQGAFKLAIEKQVPIIPITFTNNWKLLQNGGFFKAPCRPGMAGVILHTPIPTTGITLEAVDELNKKVRDIIQQGLQHKKR